MMPFLLIVFLLISSIEAALAQRVEITEVGFKLSDKDREMISHIAKYEAKLYNSLFHTNRNDTLKILVSVFKKQSHYQKACEKDGIKVISKQGLYSPSTRLSYVYKSPDFINTIIHEMGHAFMHHNFKAPPRWLNEGISEFLESLRVTDGKMSVEQQAQRLSRVKQNLAIKKFDVKQFIELNHTEWQSKETVGHMYDVSYSMIFFMIKTNPNSLVELLAALQKNRRHSVSAIEAVYGSLHNFQEQYTRFYGNYNIL